MPLCLRQTPSWVERNRVPMDIVIGQAQRHRWSSGRGAFPPGAGPADVRLLGTKAGQAYGSEAFSQRDGGDSDSGTSAGRSGSSWPERLSGGRRAGPESRQGDGVL